MGIVQALAERIVTAAAEEDSPFFVAMCGWADTGKSTLAAKLCSVIKSKNVEADWISTDVFLQNRADRNRLGISGYNPSSIDAIELSVAVNRLAALHEYIYHPYDNRVGGKVLSSKQISPHSIIVIEGIHAFHEAIWRHCRLRIFIVQMREH